MPLDDTTIAAWLAAIERFRQTRSAWAEWNSRNPYPKEGTLPKDLDLEEEAAILANWERESEAVGGPYDEAREALYALPAPNLEAVIVKLQLAREILDGWDVQRELMPILQLVEQDLRRIADEADDPKMMWLGHTAS